MCFPPLVLGCPAAALSGVAIGAAVDWALSPIERTLRGPSALELSATDNPLEGDGAAYAVQRYNTPIARVARIGIAIALGGWLKDVAVNFYGASDNMARYTL